MKSKKTTLGAFVAATIVGACIMLLSPINSKAKGEVCIFSLEYCCSNAGTTYCGVCEGCEVN